MQLKSNERGFSIIEVLVCLAVVMFVFMAIAQMMRDSSNVANLSEARFDEQELMRQAQLNFNDKKVCADNFRGHVMTGPVNNEYGFNDIKSIKSFSGSPFATKDDLFGNRSLTVREFAIRATAADWTAFQSGKTSWVAGQTYGSLPASFVVTTEKMKTTFGGKMTTKKMALKLYVDAANRVVDCSASTDSDGQAALAATCAQMGGTFDPATNTCALTQSCDAMDPNKPVPARCVADLVKLVTDLQNQIIKLRTDVTTVAQAPPSTPKTPASSAFDGKYNQIYVPLSKNYVDNCKNNTAANVTLSASTISCDAMVGGSRLVFSVDALAPTATVIQNGTIKSFTGQEAADFIKTLSQTAGYSF